MFYVILLNLYNFKYLKYTNILIGYVTNFDYKNKIIQMKIQFLQMSNYIQSKLNPTKY